MSIERPQRQTCSDKENHGIDLESITSGDSSAEENWTCQQLTSDLRRATAPKAIQQAHSSKSHGSGMEQSRLAFEEGKMKGSKTHSTGKLPTYKYLQFFPSARKSSEISEQSLNSEDSQTRLRNGANQKRAPTAADLDVLNSPPRPFSHSGQPRTLPAKAISVQKSFRGYIRRQSASASPHAQRKVDYAASIMPSESPGAWKRKREHSSEVAPVLGRLNSVPSTSSEEDSEDSYENEGAVLHAKRIKPNPQGPSKQHSSLVEDNEYMFWENGRFGVRLLTMNSELPVAQTSREAGLQTPAEQTKKGPGKRTLWPARERYNDSTKHSLPDFLAPKTDTDPVKMNKSVFGMKSFTPVNRLGTQSQQPPPRARNSGKEKAFDLTSGRALGPRNDTPPRKKQRTDGSSEISIQTNGETTGHESVKGGGLARNQKTRRSENRNGQGRLGAVQEYRGVQDTVSLRHEAKRRRERRSGSMDDLHQDGGTTACAPAPKSAIKVVRIGDTEDPDDPIDDSGMEKSTRSPRLQVVIPITDDPKPGYSGSANLRPARPRDVKGPARKLVKRSSSPKRSSPPHVRQPITQDDAFEELSGHRLSKPVSQIKRQSNNSFRQPTLVPHPQRHIPLDDGSLDELSNDHVVDTNSQDGFEQVAMALLTKHKNRKVSQPPMNGQHNNAMTVDLETSSDEERKSKRADMHKTNFTRSKDSAVTFGVQQLLTATGVCLISNSNKDFSMRYNQGRFDIIDQNGKEILHFTLNSVHNVLYAKENEKIVIHKSTEASCANAPNIYLELTSLKDFRRIDKIFRSSLTIKRLLRDDDHLDRTFTFTLSQFNSNPQKRGLTREEEEPEDLQLARKKCESRNEAALTKAQESKRGSGQRLVDKLSSDGVSAQEGRRMSNTKSARFPLGAMELDYSTSKQTEQPAEVAPDVFYQSSQMASHRTRSSVRVAERDTATRQSPRQHSPPPDRWTQSHPDWAKDWKSSVVYPLEGKDRAVVDKQDIERLDEGEFLNDNLIIFYLRWLEHRLVKDRPELAKRIYFHNTYFYARLTTTAKGKKGINYDAVARWTAKVDLLSYDYIIVPVNEHTHWYVAIICNAPRLLKSVSKDQEVPLQPQEQVENLESEVHRAVEQSALGAKHRHFSSSEPEVDSRLQQMSLEDENPIELEKSSVLEAHLLDKVTTEQIDEVVQVNADRPETDEAGDAEGFVEENVVLNKPQPSAKATPPKRGRRKPATPRKYDPLEPRIITLDSLGIKHSPTCINLRDYLVAEIKAKHGIDIPSPGPIGMTANHLPTQNNFCDCGLFLLSYIEKFLEQPDEFVRCILQSHDLEIEWRKSSDMRNDIRELLFRLQAEQNSVADKTPREKVKRKRTSKGEPQLSTFEAQILSTLTVQQPSINPTTPDTAESRPILDQKHPVPEEPKRSSVPNGDVIELPDSQETMVSAPEKCGRKGDLLHRLSGAVSGVMKGLRSQYLSGGNNEPTSREPESGRSEPFAFSGHINSQDAGAGSLSSEFPSPSRLQRPISRSLDYPFLDAAAQSRSLDQVSSPVGWSTKKDAGRSPYSDDYSDRFQRSPGQGRRSSPRNSVDRVHSRLEREDDKRKSAEDDQNESEMLMASEGSRTGGYAYNRSAKKSPETKSRHFPPSGVKASPTSKKRKNAPQKPAKGVEGVIDLDREEGDPLSRDALDRAIIGGRRS